MSDRSQSFTFTKNVGRGFVLSSTPKQSNVSQPYQMKISPQGIISSEKASNTPGFCPVKGQNLNLGTQTESRN
jgi:hypothetical protein